MAVAFSTVAFAQDHPSDSETDVIRVRTDLVTVPFFVADARGHRISNLARSDFSVRDNGAEVEVSYFAAGTARVAVIFAVDASGSVRDVMAEQRETALALIPQFGHSLRLAIFRFSERPELVVPFTDDVDEARAALHFPAIRNRHTAIFDAALAAINAFDTEGADRTERRIIILLSDGLDTASRTRASEVVNAAQERGVSIYVIHFPLFVPSEGHLVPRAPSKGFRELAEQSGGHYFMVGDARTALDPRAEYDLSPIFRAITEDLQSQYVLGYYAGETARATRYHHIAISLTPGHDRKLRIRTLRESYALDEPAPGVGNQRD